MKYIYIYIDLDDMKGKNGFQIFLDMRLKKIFTGQN